MLFQKHFMKCANEFIETKFNCQDRSLSRILDHTNSFNLFCEPAKLLGVLFFFTAELKK